MAGGGAAAERGAAWCLQTTGSPAAAREQSLLTPDRCRACCWLLLGAPRGRHHRPPPLRPAASSLSSTPWSIIIHSHPPQQTSVFCSASVLIAVISADVASCGASGGRRQELCPTKRSLSSTLPHRPHCNSPHADGISVFADACAQPATPVRAPLAIFFGQAGVLSSLCGVLSLVRGCAHSPSTGLRSLAELRAT